MMERDRALDQPQRVSTGVSPLWRTACVVSIGLPIVVAMWCYADTYFRSRAIVRDILSDCNMNAVFPAMLVPQSRNLIVFIDDHNSDDDIRSLVEIIERHASRLDRVWINVDGDRWQGRDFNSLVDCCHRHSIYVDVYVSRLDKDFWCVMH